MTQPKIIVLEWDIHVHRTYSEDLSPSEYDLFHSIHYVFFGQWFQWFHEIEKWIEHLIESKLESYVCG